MGKFSLFFLAVISSYANDNFTISLFDSETKKPLENFRVVIDNTSVQNFNQKVVIDKNHKVDILAIGYEKKSLLPIGDMELYLKPFVVKGLYLSNYGISYKPFIDNALKIAKSGQINTFVIDIKNENGMMSYEMDNLTVNELGANKINTIKDIKKLLSVLKENNIYSVARIAIFKDALLSQKKPNFGIKTKSGKQYLDKQNVPWSDPFQKEVRDYNIAIGVEAAKVGFDEVQFDYVRFPDAVDYVTSQPSNENSRIEVINSFLDEAREAINKQGAFMSADIFGYVLWNKGDMGIGQKLESILNHVDYLSPMLYPSGFTFGIPGYKIPTQNSYEIIYLSLKEAQKKVPIINPIKIRPWLQAFKDYSFDRREYKGKEVYKQIKATEDFGKMGYLFWNPRNRYDLNLFEYKPEMQPQRETTVIQSGMTSKM
ncbi:MAG: putative glycoside hydrolase [Sulfurimonas sp.]|jgi:hypothetical protein